MIQKIREKITQRYKKRKWFVFLTEFFRRFAEDNVAAVGAQLAYYLIMSFFPFLIFLLSVLTFTTLGQEDVLATLLSALPAETSKVIYPIIMDIISLRSGTVLSLSLALALWAGSSGTMNLMGAIDYAFDVKDRRNVIIRRLTAVFYTILLTVLIVITLLGQVFGDFLLSKIFEMIGHNQWIENIWNMFKLILPFSSMLIGFTLFYKFAPGFPKGRRITLRQALLGSVVATLGWIGLSELFKIYVANFSNYANTYGSIGAVIVLLLWLFMSAILLMLGAEVIAAYVNVYKKGLSYLTDRTQGPVSVNVAASRRSKTGRAQHPGNATAKKAMRVKPRYIMRREEKTEEVKG